MIVVDSILPAKNAQNVDVNSDVRIHVNANFKLDPRNVSFKINEVDVVCNTFSVYNDEEDSTELEITLYTRRRIKYNTGRRYGQDNVRYGMRDSYPSMLQYGGRYIIEFSVWGTNADGIEERITDRFAFSTEQGVFHNERPTEYFYSYATQGMANYMPEWAKARFDKFSNMQQMINPIGTELEKLQDFVTEQGLNNFIQTANLKQLPFLHKVELGKDFEIKSVLNEDGSTFYVQPEISGIQGITRYDLFTTAKNDLSSAYYGAVPTRIDAERIYLENNIIYGPITATEVKQTIDRELERAGTFWIKTTGLKSSIYLTDKNEVLFVKCRITGKSLFNTDQTEDIVLYNERELQSSKLWSHLDSVEFFNLSNQVLTFEIKHFRDAFGIVSDKKTITTFEDNKETLFWKAEKIGPRTILQKHITVGDTALDLLRSAGATQAIQEYELLDIDRETNCNLVDIAVDGFSNHIYACCQEYLYVFDKREPYAERLKEIPGDNGLADFLIELDADEMGLDEDGQKEILCKLVHRKPGKTIVRYRLRMRKPDGTEVFIKDNGSYTNDLAQATIFPKQTDIVLNERQFTFVADQIGEYILDLETVYRNGETSRHRQLFRILSMSAIVKYKLRRILNDEVPVGLVLDADQKLKILTDRNSIYSLSLHHDGVVIDYDNKILYFVEEYESVDVT